MKPNGIITLLTDFGLSEPFVGLMKGAIYKRFPEAQIVDLTHQVRPFAIAEGAFWLAQSYAYFPSGTTHVAVVDPGVGGPRRALALCAHGQYFIAPDNGLLARVVERADSIALREIVPAALGLGSISPTFHGRDVFAPAAALLASWKVGFATLGPLVEAALPEPRRAMPAPAEFAGEVIVIDHFGNAFTSIEGALLNPPEAFEIWVGDRACRLCRTYSEADLGEVVAIVNSFGVVELAVREGNAACQLGIAHGAPVRALRRDAQIGCAVGQVPSD